MANDVSKFEFGPWVLDSQSQLLHRERQQIHLEPLLFDLLIYFITHRDRVVSRQDLVENVWQQGFVDDNAINRAISELRKTLKCDEGPSTYIKTHYKKGYSFVPEVIVGFNSRPTEPNGLQDSSLLTDNTDEPDQHQVKVSLKTAKNKKTGSILLVLLLLAITLGGTSWFMVQQDDPTASSSKVIASRNNILYEKGLVIDPLASQDQRLLAFSFNPLSESPDEKKSQGLNIYVRDMLNAKVMKAVAQPGDLFPVALDNHGRLIYQRIDVDSSPDGFACEVFMANISDLDDLPSKGEKLFDCVGNKEIKGELVDNGNTLIYTKSGYRDVNVLSALVARDLKKGTEFQITSPPMVRYGDYLVRASKQQQQLIFARDTQQGTALYLTDRDGTSPRLLTEMNYYISSLHWSEDGRSISWLNPKRWEVIELQLDEGKQHVYSLGFDTWINQFNSIELLSASRFVFASDYIENDIFSVDVSAGDMTMSPVLVSSDKETRFIADKSQDTGLYTKRASTTQLWQKVGQQHTMVTDLPFDDLLGIDISPRGTRYIIARDYQITFYQRQSHESLNTLRFDDKLIAASWFDEERLLIIKKTDTQRLAGLFDISQNSFTPLHNDNIEALQRIDDKRVALLDPSKNLIIVNDRGDILYKQSQPQLTQSNWVIINDDLYYEANITQIWRQPLTPDSTANFVLDMGRRSSIYLATSSFTGLLYITTSELSFNTLYDVNFTR